MSLKVPHRLWEALVALAGPHQDGGVAQEEAGSPGGRVCLLQDRGWQTQAKAAEKG